MQSYVVPMFTLLSRKRCRKGATHERSLPSHDGGAFAGSLTSVMSTVLPRLWPDFAAI